MLNTSTLTLFGSFAFSSISSDSFYHQFVTCHLGRKTLSAFVVTHSLVVALNRTTRELYIWVPALDDVKAGADPKPAAQRVPQRGRLHVVFPSCASVTSSCRGEPQGAIWGGLGPEHVGLSTANSSYLDWASGGGLSLELEPPACNFNCFEIHFPCSLLCHQGAHHFDDQVYSLIQSDARPELAHLF